MPQEKKGKKVTLLRYVRTQDKGWVRRKFKETGKRGWEQRIDSDCKHFGADVIGVGEYQLRWFELKNGKSKPRYESGGETYLGAKKALTDRQDRLGYNSAAERVGAPPLPEDAQHQTLTEKLEPYLRARRLKKKITSEDTEHVYRRALERFTAITQVRYSESVDEETIQKYLDGLAKRWPDAQSQRNQFAAVSGLLRDCEPSLTKLLREYTPKVTPKNPKDYKREELENLLAALYAGPPQWQRLALALEIYWKTGIREKELVYLVWDLVDLEGGFLSIIDNREMPFRGRDGIVETRVFRTKGRKDRKLRLPIEPALLEHLRAWRTAHPQDRYLFHTRTGNPDTELLPQLKHAIHQAGFSCGKCEHCLNPCGKCSHCRCRKCKRCRERGWRCLDPHPGAHPCTRIECEKWILHRLRHSFATTAVRSKKVDLGMLMNMLGHEKLSTTQIYLSAAKEEEAQAAVSGIFS